MRSISLLLLAGTALALSPAVAAPVAKPAKAEKPAGAAIGPVAGQDAALAADKPQIGTFGFDTAGMDRAVKPGDDFAAFAGGTWKRDIPIPADRSNWGMFTVLAELSQTRTRTILDAAAKTPGDKAGDLYASFLDEGAAEAKGIAPIQPTLAEIRAAASRSAIAAEMGKMRRLGIGSPFRVDVGQDDRIPDQYIVSLRQAGLGLPGRDYYLGQDAKLAAVRTAYATHLARLLELAGEGDGASRAAAVIAFETRLATAHWTRIAERDVEKTYNKWTLADFTNKAPGFDWSAFFTGAGIKPQPAYLVAQSTAFTGEAQAIAATPPAVLRDYLMLRVLEGYAPYLSKKLVDENFGFAGTVLSGTPQNQDRWKRGVTLTSGLLGEAVGKEYVAQYFPPEAKVAADTLVHNLIAAFDQRLANLAWMSPETKVKARAKLAAFTPKIGYPDKWRDYSAYCVDRADLVGNVMRGRDFDWQYDINKLGQPIDRGEWGMTPMTVNAYANPVMNEIVFPAAILQPPFFDPHADPAVNYGGIGVVIGHEMSHHFDDQGSHYDLTGKLTDWWTPTDVTRFGALTKQLVDQYDAYEPLPGVHIQGGMTLGENIADLAGLSIARDAYLRSLGGKAPPVMGGFTADQRFYLGYAQVWRIKFREAALRQQLLTNEHSPGDYRAAEVRNLDAWYDAFAVKPGEKLYLPPEQRVRIW